mgnify:CR=1 FL=1
MQKKLTVKRMNKEITVERKTVTWVDCYGKEQKQYVWIKTTPKTSKNVRGE